MVTLQPIISIVSGHLFGFNQLIGKEGLASSKQLIKSAKKFQKSGHFCHVFNMAANLFCKCGLNASASKHVF